MKNFIYCSILILGSLSQYSCQIQEQDATERKPYYRFNEIDRLSMINYNYKDGQIIIYQNQFGEQIHFKVLSNISEKSGSYSGGFFFGVTTLLSSYDSKIIRIEILDYSGNWYESSVLAP
jgi:hypothetical protein